MQNTMVGGGGKWLAGENENEELGKKNKKGEEKGRKNTWKKALKMHLFGS